MTRPTLFTRRRTSHRSLVLKPLIAAAAILLLVVGILANTGSASAATSSIWGSAAPQIASADDDDAVELGTRFIATGSGSVTGIRFFKGAGNTGSHRGRLWSSDGSVLASVTFGAETESGWQTAKLAKPYPVSAGKTYVVSYLAPEGHYSLTTGVFADDTMVSRPSLVATAGLYSYSLGFPTSTWRDSNYFVDVTFDTAARDEEPDTDPDSPVPTTPAPSPSQPATPLPPQPPTTPPSDSDTSGASNTGVADCAALPAYTGPSTIEADGTLIDGKRITGQITVNADNVTVKGSCLSSPSTYGFLVWGKNFALQDSEITGQAKQVAVAGYSDKGGGDTHLTRVDISGSPDLVRMGGNNSTLRDSYLHDVCRSACPDAHNDTVGVLPGVKGTVIDGNTIFNENSQTAAVEIGDIRSSTTSGQLTNNLIGGGGYTIYSGKGDGTGFTVTGNRFTTRFYPRIGYWGAAYSWTTEGGNSWSGNTYVDGPNVGQTVSVK